MSTTPPRPQPYPAPPRPQPYPAPPRPAGLAPSTKATAPYGPVWPPVLAKLEVLARVAEQLESLFHGKTWTDNVAATAVRNAIDQCEHAHASLAMHELEDTITQAFNSRNIHALPTFVHRLSMYYSFKVQSSADGTTTTVIGTK